MSLSCRRWVRNVGDHHQESFTNKKWTHLTKITFGSAVNCGRRFFCSVFQYVPRSFRAYYDFLSAAKSSEFISSTNGRMLKTINFLNVHLHCSWKYSRQTRHHKNSWFCSVFSHSPHLTYFSPSSWKAISNKILLLI